MNCPGCGSEVSAEAKFCPNCGTRLEEASASSGDKTCAECGGTLRPAAKFCHHCGAAVLDVDPQTVYQAKWDDYDLGDTASAPTRSRRLQSTLLPLLMVPVLVLVFFMLSRNQQSPQKQQANTAAAQPNMQQMETVFRQIDSLRASLQENPKDTTALLVLGEMYEIASRFEEAQDYYSRYLEINPDNFDVQMRVANIYFNLKNFNAAESTLKAILLKQPNNAYALYNYALTLHLMGDIDGAVAHWQKAIEADPDGQIGKQAREAIQTVSMMRGQK